MNIAIKDACACTFYDRNTGKPEMYSDYFNTFSLSVSQETVFAKVLREEPEDDQHGESVRNQYCYWTVLYQ